MLRIKSPTVQDTLGDGNCILKVVSLLVYRATPSFTLQKSEGSDLIDCMLMYTPVQNA